MITKTKKVASPVYIAVEYCILTAILAWIISMIVGFILGLVLDALFNIDPTANPFYFYATAVLIPFVYWFVVKYSALDIGKRYLINDAKKTANFAIGCKVVLFVGVIIYNLVNFSSSLQLWNQISETLQLAGGSYAYGILTIISSIISVAIFWIATKKYIKAEII